MMSVQNDDGCMAIRKILNSLIFILIFGSISAQVGVNTTNPDASSVLDVSSTEKGILIPRINLTNVTNAQLDGTNTAATGLLIFNTNASVVGGSGIGFYVFNGTNWEKLTTTSDSFSDADFFEEGTTDAPNDISDDIYTEGNVAIGKTTADHTLDLESTGTRGINSVLNNNADDNLYGFNNEVVTSGLGQHFGIFNRVNATGSSSRDYGVYNYVTTSTPISSISTYNYMDGAGSGNIIGTQNQIVSTSTGDFMGTRNQISGSQNGNKYGSYNFIFSSSGGTHYGVYSSALKSGSYAGYFLGNVSIGTSASNNYLLPPSRGTNGQVIQTDGTGNLSWTDPFSFASDRWSLNGNSGTNPNVNFVGTTDNVDLIFKRNNQIYGIFGFNNTSIGKFSLTNNTGLYNTSYGNFAMSNHDSGNYNTAVGEQAMQRHENGATNTTLGALSLYLNETGSGNIAIGFQAGRSELGSNRLYIENSASTTPLIYGEFDNDILRTYGDFQVNDPSSTAQSGLIQNDDSFVHLVDNNIDFGAGGNHMMLSSQEGGFETGGIHVDGNSVTIWSPADGLRALRILDEDDWNDNDGNPFNNTAELAYIDNNGQYVQASDTNRKQNIQKINNALERLQKLNGYTYEYKINAAERAKGEKSQQTSGVLAQELQQVLPEAVQVSESGEFFVHYAGITPLLIEALKELKEENKELKTNYKLLEQRLSVLERLIKTKE